MKYTIKKLAELAGISTRTLRYYDQIGLLKPDYVNESNYRIYNEKNVNKLQQIMFYRSLDFSLAKIKQVMDDPEFSQLDALQEQRELLLAKQAEIKTLLISVDQTIKDHQGEITMKDSEKFAAFKYNKLSENEVQYGPEVRQEYGNDVVEAANDKFGKLSENEFEEMKAVEKQLIANLVELKRHPDLESPLAQSIYQEHKQWLGYTWPNYTKKAHRGLVEMYLADNRFQKYYDEKANTPVVQLLHDVVYQYTK